MKALTLRQPYASLVARDQKQYETRSWSTSYRGLLAVHAGKYDDGWGDDLPRGAIVAVVNLANVHHTDGLLALSKWEREVGDFSPGRYAWELTDVVKLDKPIPCRGAQGLWTPSGDILQQIEEAKA